MRATGECYFQSATFRRNFAIWFPCDVLQDSFEKQQSDDKVEFLGEIMFKKKHGLNHEEFEFDFFMQQVYFYHHYVSF